MAGAEVAAGLADFSLRVRVYYEDTDAGGVVYHASYLRFLERARTEWLRSRGFDQATLASGEGVVLVVREVQVQYLRPARLDDLLEVDLRSVERGRSRLVQEQRVLRDGEPITLARIGLVCVNRRTFRPVALPDVVRRALWPGDA